MTHSRLLIVTAVSISLLATAGVLAGERGPSTQEERTHFVQVTHALERDPLADGAREKRQALFEWLVEVPDVHAGACADLLAGARDDSYPYSSVITLHEALAAGVFVIENPDKSQDEIAMYVAGVEGALRVYEAILRSKPDAKLTFLDGLLAKRERGELGLYVAKVAKKKCK